MNTNKKGFTLIELLVVIVIIGILATISVATFGGYFKKARDSERQSAVQNIATIMKVLQATEETTDYSIVLTAAADAAVLDYKDLNASLSGQGYTVPEAKNAHSYHYGWSTDKEDFVIAVCSEENHSSTTASEQYFAAGTPDGVAAVTGCTAPAGAITTYNATVGGEFNTNKITW